MKKCRLYTKLNRGTPLSEAEVKLLGNIIREELKFLVRNNILPTPKNYEKWFLVFCFIFEKDGKLPADSEIIEIFKTLHSDERVSEIRLDLELTLELLNKLMNDFHHLITEHGEYTSKKEKELTDMEGEIPNRELASMLMELLTHIKDIKSQNEVFLKKIEEQQNTIKELRQKLQQAESEANLDYLTNTFNRRSFERALREVFNEYKERKSTFSLALIDLDNFKYINDKFGHPAGDVVLRRIAFLLRQNLRARDILARWGGDEFAILMPGTSQDWAVKVLERLKKTVEESDIIIEGERVGISFSFGVVEPKEYHADLEDMIKEADELMYSGKRGKAS